ncbi:hypothetical protein [Blastococcus sp. SYSU DS0616]
MRALQIRSSWRPLEGAETRSLEPAVGVYEIRVAGVVRLIGYAGARSLFGLRGELTARAGQLPGAEFRAEVTTAYLTRWHELLATHVATFGSPPPDNDPDELPRPLLPIGPRGEAIP